MKLDSNRAWKDASRSISRNRDTSLAIAGVFFLLPQLALALFFPQPEPTAGMSEQQILELAQTYYLSTLPAMIPLILAQALGTLGLLCLLRHAASPTVGEALRLGAAGLATYLAAQIVVALAVGVVGGLILSLLALSGAAALAVAGLFLIVLLTIAIAVRVSLSGAVVAIEGERNPIRALRRSWALTADHGWRLFGFYALFLLAFFVILTIVSVILGIPLQMMASSRTVELATALISSGLNALMALYLVGIVGAVHGQLAGRTAEEEQRPFE
ncbi:hypothetical protein ABVV53_16765 [Novosphingobium sp. RD2P27]|uniref:DUF7847 domain-containing protein n=1 Tax=Novosphingobium kalidii TaxID=3230299 RepID=A0ABV2D5U4_9SPHN